MINLLLCQEGLFPLGREAKLSPHRIRSLKFVRWGNQSADYNALLKMVMMVVLKANQCEGREASKDHRETG